MTTAKRRQSTQDMHAVRPILEERSGGFCEACAAPLRATDTGYDAAHHHRKLRSRGGTDGPENALLCHHQCHANIHARPAKAKALGHMVSSWSDPSDAALIYQGRHARLNVDGSVTYLDEVTF